MDAVRVECPILPPISVATVALQRALLEIKINEQKLADCKQELSDFRQEVSDVASVCAQHFCENSWTVGDRQDHVDMLHRFIIPAPKPDPLVDVLTEISGEGGFDNFGHYAHRLRAALDALGFEIREKNDD